MATIRSKTRKDGSKSYLAQIIRRNFKYQESRTFDKESLAKKWAARTGTASGDFGRCKQAEVSFMDHSRKQEMSAKTAIGTHWNAHYASLDARDLRRKST